MVNGQHDGTIGMHNGQVVITDPVGGGMPATLVLLKGADLVVSVDGKGVGPGEYPVTSQQTVIVEGTRIEPACETKLKVASDKMTLTMGLEMRPGKLVKPTDIPPSQRLILRPQAIPLPAIPPSAQEIYNLLENGTYKGNIDAEAIDALAQATVSVERVILRGTPVFPGKAAECRPLPLPPSETDDPLHRRMQLQSVRSGTVVAVIEPAVEPQSGQDILGRAVPYKGKLRSSLPRFGEGVKRVDDKIYATRNGRLVFSPITVDVIPSVELNQSVTAKDGQVYFDGDVTIYGDVEDGSVINATGVVQVKGGVYGAVIVGERGISIRGHCVKSKVFAGWAREQAGEILAVVQTLEQQLGTYRNDVTRVLGDAREKLGGRNPEQLAAIPWIVLDKYHASLPRHILAVVQQYAKCSAHEVGKRMEPLVRMIQTSWAGQNLQAVTPEIIDALLEELQKYTSYIIRNLDQDTAVIEVNAVTSSTLEATGSIFVSGKGTYASQLDSGHAIEVKGYVRGGTLKATEAVSVRELGAPSGTETRVIVTSKSGSIKIGTRHANTLLEVGGRLDRNVVLQRDIHFTL